MQIIKYDHAGILSIQGNWSQIYFQKLFDYTGSNLVPICFQFAIKILYDFKEYPQQLCTKCLFDGQQVAKA